MTLLIAHAGCENTEIGSFESLDAAFSSDADLFEIDLREDSGVVYYYHNPLDLKILDRYIKFSQILDLFENNQKKIMIDLKSEMTHDFVIDMLVARKMDHRSYFSGLLPLSNLKKSRAFYCINAETTGVVSSGERITSQKAAALADYYFGKTAINLTGLNVNYETLTDESVEIFQKRKVPIWLWTVDDLKSVEHFLSIEVAAITTNRINEACQIKRQLIGSMNS